MTSSFFQTLELRTFLSGNPAVLPNDPTIQADQQQLLVDTQKLQSDRQSFQDTLKDDRAKVSADQKNVGDAKKLANMQLDADKKAMADALAADRAAGQPVRDVWYPIMMADVAALKADAGNSDQFAVDKAKFDADAASFRDAMAPFETQTKADIAKWNAILATDKSNVELAGKDQVDQLKTDLQTLKTDEQNFKALLKADEAAVKADTKKLKKDLCQYKKTHKSDSGDTDSKISDLVKSHEPEHHK